MEDKEIIRRFSVWDDMHNKTVVALNEAIRKIERLEESIEAIVRDFKAPREGLS